MRVALIQSADDIARYPYADTLEFVRSCCAGEPLDGEAPLRVHLRPVTVKSVTEEGLRSLLSSLSVTDWSAIVFATNALNSNVIWELVQEHEASLLDYLEAGGGLIIFQGNFQTPPRLGARLGYSAGQRQSAISETARPTLRGADDVLLAYPDALKLELLAETPGGVMTGGSGDAWGRLYWETIKLQESSRLIPVLEASSEEILLARTGDHAEHRVVVCKILADWHQLRGLMRNLLSYALSGSPNVLVAEEANEAVAYKLASEQHAVRESAASSEATRSWLKNNVQIVVATDGADLAETAEPHLLARGGAYVSGTLHPEQRACEVTALIGARSGRRAAEDLLNSLGEHPDWGEFGYAETSLYRLRNVLTCLDRLRTSYGIPFLVDLPETKITRLRSRTKASLDRIDDPLVTRIAAAECALILDGKGLSPELVEELAASSEAADGDVRLLWLSVAPQPRINMERFVTLAHEAIRNRDSIASLGRVCEALSIMHRREPIPDRDRTALCERLMEALPEPPGRVGWLSAETTATILRGLTAVEPTQPSTAYRRLLAISSAILRAELKAEPTSSQAVGWRARITEALVAVDAIMPADIDLPRIGNDGTHSDIVTGLRSANVRLYDAKLSADTRLSDYQRRNAVATRVGWAVVMCALALLFAFPILYLVLAGGPFGERLAVAGTVASLLWTALVAAIRRYPLLPAGLLQWLRRLGPSG